MGTKIIIPLLNQSVRTFRGPTWFLSEDISIEPIFPEDYGLILQHAPEEYQSLLLGRSKCIRIENIDSANSDEKCRNEASKIAFILNYFKKTKPIAVSFAVQITKVRKSKYDRVIDLPVVPDILLQRKNNYQIQEGVQRADISKFFVVVSEVFSKHSNIILTLDRFNSALSRLELTDRIIDITIALESLIPGATEVRNKFSLYNAVTSENDKNKVKGTFDLLKKLYDARSSIVHGTALSPRKYEKQIKPISDSWDEIIRIAKNAIGYHLLYIYKEKFNSWHKHQENIVLGIEKRITE